MKSPNFYEPCFTSIGGNVYGISGPGNGLGYYAAYGYPQNTFATWEEAEKTARMMNLAFNQGRLYNGNQIKKLLG